jgi:hypothetical protein
VPSLATSSAPLYVTNFSPHYLDDDLAHGGGWLAVRPTFPAVALAPEFSEILERALAS